MKLILRCPNEKCENHLSTVEMNWDGLSTMQLTVLKKCPRCGATMKADETRHDDSTDLSTLNFGKIDGMTVAQRRALLKERSNKDFKKNIEHRKKWLDANCIPKK